MPTRNAKTEQKERDNMEWHSSFALPESLRREALRTCRLRHSQRLLEQLSDLGKTAEIKPRENHGNNIGCSKRKCTSEIQHPVSAKRQTRSHNHNIKDSEGLKKAIKISREIPVVATLGEKFPAILSAEFFKCDALELAPKLLGKLLRRDDVVLQITEVEAYRPNDSACHGRFGITPRTAPVFGPGGHAYVYLCYGLHIMLNIVADLKGVGAAVLIRSCAPVAGIETIQSRRHMMSVKTELLNGPGKVGQALGLTTEWSGHPLYLPGGVEVLDGPTPDSILVGPRVGIDYANKEDVVAPWRFAISGTPWISAPKNTLRPAPAYFSVN